MSGIVNANRSYGYEEMREDLHKLRQTYPFIHEEVIGKSVLGKNIIAIRIGDGPREVHYNGAIHANEWITSLLLMKFVEDYASSVRSEIFRGKNISQLHKETSLWVAPMLNPDGVELVLEGITPEHPFYKELMIWNRGSLNFEQWKANIRGVDLNDQFPAHWDVEKNRRSTPDAGPRDYPGTAPLTEPETISIADFTKQHDFRLVIALHTQGQEIYWNYRDMEPPESAEISLKFGEASGYRPVKLSDSDAGYKDWFIQQFHRPGFTVEAGLGVNPLPLSQFSDINEKVVQILLLGLEV